MREETSRPQQISSTPLKRNKMKVIKAKAYNSFTAFLMAMGNNFIHKDGAIYILGTKDVEKFSDYCLRNGVRAGLIDGLEMEEADLDYEDIFPSPF